MGDAPQIAWIACSVTIKPADRHQDLLQVAAIDRPHDDALEQRPNAGGDDHRHQDAQAEQTEIERERVGLRPTGQRAQHQKSRVGTQRDEHAVSEIDHVHEAEHQVRPRRHQEDHHPHGEPRDRERHPGREVAEQRRCRVP
jgi:hypothetical protein